MEIKESERRAHSQAEVLKNALDEHSLELRVKAANEAEAACQQRLSAAEAEIAELRAKLDASERFIFYLMFCILRLQNILCCPIPLYTIAYCYSKSKEMRQIAACFCWI